MENIEENIETKKPIPTGLVIFYAAIIAFTAGYLFGQSPIAPLNVFNQNMANIAAENPEDIAAFSEVWDLIHARYYQQPLDDTLLIEGAIEGMLATLDDDYTRYLSAEDQQMAEESMSGEFQGIGAEVEGVDGDITIVSPIDGSPAEAVGLQPGDILQEANGVVLTGMDVSEAAALVRGPAGTTVTLLIVRDGESFTVDITRDVIKLATARGEMLEDDIAYIRLSRFGNNTAEELNEFLPELIAQNPVGIVLDLRRNPGGALDTTIDIADEFLDEGIVLVERFGDGRLKEFESTDKGIAEDIPMVVLIDEGSASASEVLSGAIRDNERGILIGQQSFGKGTVQTWHPLSNSGGVRVTIAEWLTPNQDSIHKVGLQPDYYIPSGETPDEDVQLQAAIDYLRGITIISIPPTPEPEE